MAKGNGRTTRQTAAAASASNARSPTESSAERSSEREVEENAQNMSGNGIGANAAGGQSAGGQNPVEMGQVLGALAQLLARLPAPTPASGAVPPPEVQGQDQNASVRVPAYLTMLEMMGKLGTRRFGGESDPVKADEWRSRLERNFASIRCPDDYKKDIAIHFLGEEANDWWVGVSGSMRNPDCSWTTFLEAFRAKYFPPEAAERLENEFLALRQGNRSIRELEVEFNRLKKYSGRDMTEEAEIRAFMRCIRIDLRNRVMTRKVETLTELVETAASLESGLAEEARLMGRGKLTVAPVQVAKSGNMSGNKRKFDKFQGNNKGASAKVPCVHCGKMHPGPCRMVSGGCFRCGSTDHKLSECTKEKSCYHCGEPGHIKPNCPKLVQGGNQPAAKKQATTNTVMPRVYAIEDGNIGASSSRPITG